MTRLFPGRARAGIDVTDEIHYIDRGLLYIYFVQITWYKHQKIISTQP